MHQSSAIPAENGPIRIVQRCPIHLLNGPAILGIYATRFPLPLHFSNQLKHDMHRNVIIGIKTVVVTVALLVLLYQLALLIKCLRLSELPLQNAAGTLSILAFLSLALITISYRPEPTGTDDKYVPSTGASIKAALPGAKVLCTPLGNAHHQGPRQSWRAPS